MDIQKMFFSFDGRLNRKPFILGNLALWVISSIFGFIMNGSDSTLISILGFVAGLALIAGSISLIVKRLHDLDKNGLFALILLVPIVNFFFELYLLFVKGTDGSNKFGEDPLQQAY